MKASEALDKINAFLDKCDFDRRYDEDTIEAVNEAIEALEMRIPVKPEMSTESMNKKLYKLRCPKCGAILAHGNSVIKYEYRIIPQSDICYMCGQKIRWEDKK